MKAVIITTIILFLIGIVFDLLKKENNTKENNYTIKEKPITNTELKFIKCLKPITDKNNLIIIPQINLQSVFKTSNRNISAFNKIKSKSIDFAIVDINYNYKLFIELDDYTHNRKKRKERDLFINELFNKYNLKLKRIKVENEYKQEELEDMVNEIISNQLSS